MYRLILPLFYRFEMADSSRAKQKTARGGSPTATPSRTLKRMLGDAGIQVSLH